jgi:transposase
VIDRKKEILYYDCTNYYFEIEDEDNFRRYGASKEHRPNPIVQMGLFMDADGIPLSFSLFNGNENEQPSMSPLEKKIIKDFGTSDFIVCTDAGLSSTANRKFNSIQGRGFVTTQSIKKLKGFLRDFCLDDDGWYLPDSKKVYKLSELDEGACYDKVFYKDRWINEDNLEQHLIVTYSIKYRNYQRTIRDRQIERAKKYVDSPSKFTNKKVNDPKRFVEQDHCTSDGEIANKVITSLNQTQIDEEAKYDGFYAVCTNLEYSVSDIVKINQKRWEIEECFRIMKTEFKARPVYLSRKDRITAHFTTCFTALIIYRILEKKLNEKYTCEELINTIRSMNMMIAPGEGYIPTYTRTDITDALHEAFGFRTDYQITSQKNMRKILNQTKKK